MSILLAIPFFFFLPGYMITLLLPWVRGLSQRISISIITSIAIGVVTSIVLSLVKIPAGTFLFLILAVTSLGGLFFMRRRAGILFKEWKSAMKWERVFVISVFILSVLAAIFIAIPHRGYPWPIHADEWWTAGTVQNLIEGQSLNAHPYLPIDFPNYKPGFSSYLAAIFDVSGYDPVHSWAYLPAINVFLISFTVSLLIFGQTGNFFAGLLLPIFLVALRSDINILGWWFFVPSMFAFLLLLPIVLSVNDWLRFSSGLGWGVLMFGALFLVYLPFGVLTLLALAPLAFSIFNKHRRVLLSASLALGAAAIMAAVVFSPYKIYWQVADINFSSPLVEKIVSASFVPAGATIPHYNYNFFNFVKWPLLVLALLGVWYLRRKRWAWGILLAGAIAGLNLILFLLTGVSFLLFYQRNFYFLGVIAAVLAVFGLFYLLDKILKSPLLKNYVYPASRKAPLFRAGMKGLIKSLSSRKAPYFSTGCGAYARFFGTVLIAAMVVGGIFVGYFKLPTGTQLYYLVSEEDLAATRWLRAQPELKGKTVLADQFTGTIITPLTRLYSKLSSLTSQNIQSVVNPADSLFFLKSCEVKEDIMRWLAADLVYSKMPLDCAFLKEMYRSTGTFIYLYSKSGGTQN